MNNVKSSIHRIGNAVFIVCGENEYRLGIGPRFHTKILSHGIYTSYNIVTVEGAAASRVFFHLKAEAVRMGE